MKLICVICVHLFYFNVVISRVEGFWIAKDRTVSGLRKQVDNYEDQIRGELTSLAARYSGETDPDAKSKFTRGIEYFEKEMSEVSEEAYLHVLELCRGDKASHCQGQVDAYLEETYQTLHLGILRFELDSYFSFNEYISEENSSSGPLSDQVKITRKDVEDRVRTIWNMLVLRVASQNQKVADITVPDNKKDPKKKMFENDLFFLLKLGGVSKVIYGDAMKICGGDMASSDKILTCSQDPMKYIERRFTPLWIYIEEREQVILSLIAENSGTEKFPDA